MHPRLPAPPHICHPQGAAFPAAARQTSTPRLRRPPTPLPRPPLCPAHPPQVYDGSKARWREGDPPRPVNAYGRTKLAAERAVAAGWPNHAILRSSIIFGPEPPVPVGRPLFLQFIDGALAAGVRGRARRGCCCSAAALGWGQAPAAGLSMASQTLP